MTEATDSRSATAIRFPSELHDRLRQASEDYGLPINYLVNHAVSEFLDYLLPPSEIRFTRDRKEATDG